MKKLLAILMAGVLGLALFGTQASAKNAKEDACTQCLQCKQFCRGYSNVSGCVLNNCTNTCNTCDKLRGYKIIIMD